jgi:hypothetical protein
VLLDAEDVSVLPCQRLYLLDIHGFDRMEYLCFAQLKGARIKAAPLLAETRKGNGARAHIALHRDSVRATFPP